MATIYAIQTPTKEMFIYANKILGDNYYDTAWDIHEEETCILSNGCGFGPHKGEYYPLISFEQWAYQQGLEGNFKFIENYEIY